MTRGRLISLILYEGLGLLVAAAALVLLYTGSAKLLAPSAFAETINTHGLIPRDLTPHVAWGVIAMELAVGISTLWLVLAERRIKPAAIGAGLVFTAFAWYAGAMILFPPPAPTGCGCAGSGVTDIADWGAITWRNAATAALLLVALPLTTNRLAAQVGTSEPPTPCAQTRH